MRNEMSFKISVLLAVYNGEKYIQEAIDSIVVQTYTNWELLIVDNGSIDTTKLICEKAAVNDSRIKFFKLKEKGKTNSYNLAFEKSSGDFICFFAADDKLTPRSLESRLNNIEDIKSGYSTCLLRTFSEDHTHNGIVFPKNKDLPNYSGGSIFFARRLADLAFPIPVTFPNEDTWTSLHLRAFGVNKHLPEVCYDYRIHDNNSYGYALSFDEKRLRFLQRMEAYQIFYDRYKDKQVPFVDNYIKFFVKGLNFAKNSQILNILFTQLPVRERLIFIFYSAPILYKLRYKYFKFFSGIFN
ncbi:MAG TPA: glycosyltransferase [Pseudoneobacillus sp.]|nr:glycosyltransferase [Pseudoneobacillus sp.]